MVERRNVWAVGIREWLDDGKRAHRELAAEPRTCSFVRPLWPHFDMKKQVLLKGAVLLSSGM